MPALIALLFALVLAAFFFSRRAGAVMLTGVSIAVALMLAWSWYSSEGTTSSRTAIPVEQVEFIDKRMRGNTIDYLVRNKNEDWTLVAIHSEKIARLEDGTLVDREEFVHRINVPPGQARWETFRFFGLEIGLDYDWRITGTEASRNPD